MQLLDGALLTTTETAIDLATNPKIFPGFDELWILEREPAERPPKDGGNITSEMPITEDADDNLLTMHAWMVAQGAVLGLGDGCGLNYLTTDWSVAAEVLEDAIPPIAG
jgi:hypothetical protein